MRLRHRSYKICLVLLFGFITVSTTEAQILAGSAKNIKGEAYRYVNENDDNPKKEPLEIDDEVFVGDKLGPNVLNGSVLTIEFACEYLSLVCDKTPMLKLDQGSVELIFNEGNNQESFLICDLTVGHYLMEGEPAPCQYVTKDGTVVKRGTVLEMDVSATDTRVFVFEGWIEVFSTDTVKYPDPREVHAGEWVRFRKGEPIPKPKKFTMAIGPGSGSTECIYSDCKLVDSVLIPSRPVVTPGELIPPPPNPPGQR